jgi:cytochrome c oxidase subunit II
VARRVSVILAVVLLCGCKAPAPLSAAGGGAPEAASRPDAGQKPGAAEVVAAAPDAGALRRIVITARQFNYTPDTLELTEGEEVLLELRTADREHGFSLLEFGLSAHILPGAPTLLRFKPERVGVFTWACNVECGSGHDLMTGTLVVKPAEPRR